MKARARVQRAPRKPAALAVPALLPGLVIGACAYFYSGRDVLFAGPEPIGNVERVSGTVLKAQAHGGPFFSRAEKLPASSRAELHPGELIQTDENSCAELWLSGGSELKLMPRTVVSFEESGDEVAIHLRFGKAEISIPPGVGKNSGFVFHQADGSEVDWTEKANLRITLASDPRFSNAVQVSSDAFRWNPSVEQGPGGAVSGFEVDLRAAFDYGTKNGRTPASSGGVVYLWSARMVKGDANAPAKWVELKLPRKLLIAKGSDARSERAKRARQGDRQDAGHK